MPKKVLPGAKEFAQCFQALEERGFRRTIRSELAQDFVRLGLTAPSPREGREVGYSFSANGLTVRVWTTFLADEQRARDSDAGWVLIVERDRVKYFSRPIHRTKNFLRNLLAHARIARLRVLWRPLCPLCNARMDITPGKGFKARYWTCYKHARPDRPRTSWDIGLPPNALAFLKPLRKLRARYVAKLRAKGKEPGDALKRRRGWQVSHPENLERA